MKTLFKTINLFLLGIFIMPSFLLLFVNKNQETVYGYYCDDTYFESDSTSTYQEVYIEYDTYTKTEILLNRFVPLYGASTRTNSCAPKAASIVVGYYDPICTNLVPDAEVGQWYNGQYYYSGFTSNMIDIYEELYDLMGTNTEAPGTSVAQFTNGFTSYVNQQGYNIQFNSCGALNLTTLQNYIQLQQPVVVFFNSYRYFVDGVQSDDGTKLEFLERTSNNGHVAVCYGYREYVFTKDDTTWTEKYLIVSFGNNTAGLMDVTNMSCVDNSYAINIY